MYRNDLHGADLGEVQPERRDGRTASKRAKKAHAIIALFLVLMPGMRPCSTSPVRALKRKHPLVLAGPDNDARFPRPEIHIFIYAVRISELSRFTVYPAGSRHA